jgi:glycosyltransferase involved in cell wall biosynthesis
MAAQRKVRVMTIVDAIGIRGGGETLARQIVQGLDPERFERSLCVTRWEADEEYEGALEELRAADVEFIGLNRGSRFDPRPWRQVLDRLRADQVDILHTHKFGSNVWGALLDARAPAPVFVAHEHTWSYSGRPIRRLLDRRLIAGRADAFVAVSNEDRRKMIEVEKIPPERIRVIPNGTALKAAGADAGLAIRRELGLWRDQPVVVAVALLRRQKALHVLIEAAVILRRRFPDLAVLVVGDDGAAERAESKRLLELVRKANAGETVRFLGHRDDIAEVLAAGDIAVLCSDYEGSPLVLMEYMEAACPVVATRVGGVPDIVLDGETGILVPPQDADRLAVAIAGLLQDPASARAMGEAGRRRRREQFDLSRTVQRVEGLYEELYARAGARSAR